MNDRELLAEAESAAEFMQSFETLREVNADLLAALERIADTNEASTRAYDLREVARAAIAKVKGEAR